MTKLADMAEDTVVLVNGKKFYVGPCKRCGGSGRHSFTPKFSDHCFACGTAAAPGHGKGLYKQPRAKREAVVAKRRARVAAAREAMVVDTLINGLVAAAHAQIREDAKPIFADVESGRRVLEGAILSMKVQDGPYGSQVKMLVLTTTNEKLWGTKPSTLNEAVRGDKVRFTATVERAKDDPKFGFFKRPTGGEVVNA